jgi:hypothetical protein
MFLTQAMPRRLGRAAAVSTVARSEHPEEDRKAPDAAERLDLAAVTGRVAVPTGPATSS